MKRQVFFDPAAEKQFSKLGKTAQKEIEKYIAKHLESEEDRDASASRTSQLKARGVTGSAISGSFA